MASNTSSPWHWGVTTLARLVTNVREETTQRLWKMPTLAEGDAEAA